MIRLEPDDVVAVHDHLRSRRWVLAEVRKFVMPGILGANWTLTYVEFGNPRIVHMIDERTGDFRLLAGFRQLP